MLVFLVGCASEYSGFREIKIPDESIGTVMLPDNWNFITDNGWLYIEDSETGDIIAFQHSRGLHYWIASEEYDEREFNPSYEYEKIGVIDYITGNSNLSNCSLGEYIIDVENIQLYEIYFTSGQDYHYSIFFVFISDEIDLKILEKISKSYDSNIE